MMNAVGVQVNSSNPVDVQPNLVDFQTEKPVATGHDLLVKIMAVSVNPIDVAVRKQVSKSSPQPKILGWDALGTVESVGSDVSLFQPGDRVFYAGDYRRAGSDAAYQLVDERLVGHAPQKLTVSQAAAMPLTALTAWEALFEKLALSPKNNEPGQTILIINGAGGVGSIAIQLAKMAGLRVIATASRPETKAWVKKMGADLILNHRQSLPQQLRATGQQDVDYILGLNDIDGHWKEMAELIKPNGRIVSITGNQHPLDLGLLKPKSVTFAWEWMYTKSFYQLPTMITQHDTLEKISQLLDQGILHSTLRQSLEPLNAKVLQQAHKMIESNHTIGKIVICN
ncbi:MAG: zinc-binding alcohol dehydrogenase family protein [Liquorilactobacillus ghanensis]|uniref:zinc-binding alcohol dehydrogenase family protein n=1 Tax=Liquorilactobacillus ghanensis TaxID=399370 RepID=UPI0039EBD4C0